MHTLRTSGAPARRHRGPARRLHPLAAVALAGALAALGCNPDRALDVEDVDVLRPGALTGPDALPVVRAGTIGNLQIAFSGGADLQNGGHEGQINISGLFSDELISAETFPDRLTVDQRAILPSAGSMLGVFLDLSKARAFADFASGRYAEFGPEDPGFSEVLSLGGFSLILFAEHYCSGVPLSTLRDDGDITYGAPQTTAELLELALAKFDSAITITGAAEDARLEQLARVGKGRALLDLGRYAEAAAAVADVPTGFSYVIESSTNSARQNNAVWYYSYSSASFSVADQEGGNGLPFASAGDPRVRAIDTGAPGFDGSTPLVLQVRYPVKESDSPLATGVEARLIEAEAALQAGDVAGWLGIHNALRADPSLYACPIGAEGCASPDPLPALADPGTAAARVDLHFRERAFWLYLTAHRLGDLRRLVRQYGRASESVFPTGEYFKGGVYGPDVNFPVSSDERNNPQFTACLDRNA